LGIGALGGGEEIGGIVGREGRKRSFVWAKCGQYGLNWYDYFELFWPMNWRNLKG
jgi:hypothetical protein